MKSKENKLELFDIIINTNEDHPALLKFISGGGILPLYEMCLEIRDNKKFTIGQERNLDFYVSDLKLF